MIVILFVLLFSISCTSKIYDIPEKQNPAISVDSNQFPFFLALHVDAKHLDYTDGSRFLRSFFNTDDATFGHAWIYLKGEKEGKIVIVEGGHSGEVSQKMLPYLDQVFIAACSGQLNPVRFLFQARDDGYFEIGSGGHKPTFSILIPISEQVFDTIVEHIDESRYPFSRYSLIDGQCTLFVVKVASLAGVDLEHELTLSIPRYIHFNGKKIELWNDPKYQSITFSSPDRLEESMRQAVIEDRAFFLEKTCK